MAKETEIKLQIADKKVLLRTLKKLRAATVGAGSGRVHEMNVLFDTPEGTVAKRGQLLRIRTETREPAVARKKRAAAAKAPQQRILLTFKLPITTENGDSGAPSANPRHKVREELELEVADAGTLTRVFEGLGMKGWFRYEKYRTTYQLPAATRWAKGLLIELDETPIGIYVELEGPPDAIDRAAIALGYHRRDYILENYLALHVRACRAAGKEPRDMLFEARK